MVLALAIDASDAAVAAAAREPMPWQQPNSSSGGRRDGRGRSSKRYGKTITKATEKL